MKEVIVKKIEHRRSVWLGVYGPDEKLFNVRIRTLKAVWSKTWKCWLLRWDRPSYNMLVNCICDYYRINDVSIRMSQNTKMRQERIERDTIFSDDNGLRIQVVQDPEGLRLWEERQR